MGVSLGLEYIPTSSSLHTECIVIHILKGVIIFSLFTDLARCTLHTPGIRVGVDDVIKRFQGLGYFCQSEREVRNSAY